jgi:hypothetical protein
MARGLHPVATARRRAVARTAQPRENAMARSTGPAPTSALRYRLLFPEGLEPEPLGYFLTEALLEARADACFPTNSGGDDEAVNVYLADLLCSLLRWEPAPDLQPGCEPLLLPPPTAAPHWQRGESYRRDGDLRLLGLGLFGRGDLLARRSVPWGYSEEDMRERDLQVGATCYRLAAIELDRLDGPRAALAPVLGRLADRFTDYVHVLEVLARGKFNLGAQLTYAALRELLPPATTS